MITLSHLRTAMFSKSWGHKLQNWNIIEQSNESHTTLLHGTLWSLLSSVSLGWSSALSANLEDWWGIKRWTIYSRLDWLKLPADHVWNFRKYPKMDHVWNRKYPKMSSTTTQPDITASDGIQGSSLMKPARPCHNSPEFNAKWSSFVFHHPKACFDRRIPPNCQGQRGSRSSKSISNTYSNSATDSFVEYVKITIKVVELYAMYFAFCRFLYSDMSPLGQCTINCSGLWCCGHGCLACAPAGESECSKAAKASQSLSLEYQNPTFIIFHPPQKHQ